MLGFIAGPKIQERGHFLTNHIRITTYLFWSLNIFLFICFWAEFSRMFLFCVFSWLVEKYKSVTSVLMRFWSEISKMFLSMFFGLIILSLKNVYSISHKSMKTAGMLLDLKNDCCTILGRYLKLQSTTSGHYSLLLTNILFELERLANVGLHYEVFKLFESGEKKESWEITYAISSCIKKRNSYPWVEKLRPLIRSSWIWSGMFLTLVLLAWGLEYLLFDL